MTTAETKTQDKQHYELPTGAIAILQDILPTAIWYKEEVKKSKLMVHSVDAEEALPVTEKRPTPTKEESQDAFEARVDKWADKVLMFEWTEKQRDAAKKCFAYYLKQANLTATPNTVALIRLFKTEDDE